MEYPGCWRRLSIMYARCSALAPCLVVCGLARASCAVCKQARRAGSSSSRSQTQVGTIVPRQRPAFLTVCRMCKRVMCHVCARVV